MGSVNYKHDLGVMERKLSNRIGLTYIFIQNNPTGTVVDAGKLRAFCEGVTCND